jgi:hypothetical protein
VLLPEFEAMMRKPYKGSLQEDLDAFACGFCYSHFGGLERAAIPQDVPPGVLTRSRGNASPGYLLWHILGSGCPQVILQKCWDTTHLQSLNVVVASPGVNHPRLEEEARKASPRGADVTVH